MVWLPDGEKKIVITRFDTIHKRDRQQDGRADGWTLHDGNVTDSKTDGQTDGHCMTA